MFSCCFPQYNIWIVILAKGCNHNGKMYAVNQEFVMDCEGRCLCRPDGKVACVPLCSLQRVQCPLGAKIEFYNEPVVGTNCSCERSRCALGEIHCTNKVFRSKCCGFVHIC